MWLIETYSRVRVGRFLSDAFPIHCELKQGDALSPLLLNFALEHGCARVAHCVTARWRNFSHYCRPLRHYDVWLRVLITEKHWQPRRQHTVYRNKRLEFAAEQEGKFCYVTAVDGGLKRFPWVAWFAHLWPKPINRYHSKSISRFLSQISQTSTTKIKSSSHK